MTRQEYLSQIKPGSNGQIGPIKSLEDYLETRKQLEFYENHTDISARFTEDDFKAFDENYNKCLKNILYKDEDNEDDINDLEKIRMMMQSVDWKWAWAGKGKTPAVPSVEQLKECINDCYESCLKSNNPRALCSTGGICVETDIYDHQVKISFDVIDIYRYDHDYDG